MAKKGGNNLNIVLGVDIAGLKKGFDDAIKVTQKAGGDVEKSAKAVSDSVQTAFKKIENSSSLKMASRQMFNLAASLQAGGTATEKAFRQAIREAGHLQDEIQDLNALIQVGGPAGPFIAMNNAMRVGLGAINSLQGATALLGGESEALQATMVKLQAGMALAAGLKELEGAKDAFEQLNMVMKLNPALAVAAGITAATIALSALAASLTDASEQQQRLNSISAKAVGAHLDEITTLQQLQTVINSTSATTDERNAAIKRAVDMAPEYLGYLNQEGITQEQINKGITDYIDLLGMRGRAEAAHQLYVEALKKQLDLERQVNEMGGRKALELAAARVGALSGIVLELDKQKGITKEYEKQFNIISRTVQLEEGRIKATPGNSKFTATKTAAAKPVWSTAIKEVAPAIKDFTTLAGGKGLSVVSQNLMELSSAVQSVSLAPRDFKMKEWQDFSAALDDITKKYAEAAVGFAAVSLGDIIAGAIMGTGGGIEAALSGLANMLGSYLAELGQQLIALSGVFAGIQVALRGLDPTGMFIAGVGLLAVSGLIKGITTRANEKSSARTGVRAFADGGVIYGPTLGLMGEYAGASANPEIVAPLDKLKSLIQPSMGNMIAETRIDGRDLVILVRNSERDMSRG